MTHGDFDKTDSCGRSRKEEFMFQPMENDDWGLSDTHSGPAGEPDAEDAESMSCWLSGLLEDPLDNSDTTEEEEDYDIDLPFLYPSSEQCSEPTTRKMEENDER